MRKTYKLLTNKREIRFFSTLGGIILIFMIISYIVGSRIQRGVLSSPAKSAVNPFESVVLTAKSAYVYDTRTKEVLYAKNADTRTPLASLTKVMSALVATDLAPDYSTIVVTNKAIEADGDSGLLVGERWSLKNLLDFSLTSSSNDGMTAVAVALGALHKTGATEEDSLQDFVSSMNKKASELNMKNTYFLNPTGLDETTNKSGAYGTAKDMSTLVAYVLENHPELLEATTADHISISSLDHTVHKAKNTDAIVNKIPGLIGSKTGFTDLAGGNLVIAFDPDLGRPVIITVLGSTEEGRFQDVVKLVNATFKSISNTAGTTSQTTPK